jgi:glyoxylase-like metal-dependent hydrolase (beta-lactamase superfamily II)/8-oxo-dGTP pyrophosphatase MutT (NUDIX family)
VSSIAEAASVLLTRGPGSQELFVVRRDLRLRAFGGFHAFPGGKVAPADAEEQFRGLPPPNSPAPSGSPEDRLSLRRVAAARELFEETGILVARRPDSSCVSSGPDLDHLRRDLILDRLSFGDVLGRLGVLLHLSDFAPVGAFVTPPFSPLRFDTTFFVVYAPPQQQANVWPGELEAGRWITAAAMLDEWNRGACLIAPPVLAILQALRGRPVDEAGARLGAMLSRPPKKGTGPLDSQVPSPFSEVVKACHPADSIPPIFYAPHVQMIPLQTLALPPSTHTNAYLVGSGPVYLLDPGPSDVAEQQLLFDALDVQYALGRHLTAVVLSHQHPDHVGAAAITAQRYGVPIWSHPLTARALVGRLSVDRELNDGDRLDLGTCPDGGHWELEALHTPGHAAGHLAFLDSRFGLLFAGDMVSTLSSVVIAPPEGDLAVYLDALRRLRQLDCRLLLPSHGGPSARPRQLLDECLAHRQEREELLLATLKTGTKFVTELAVEMYRGLPAPLMRFAELQVLAGLQKLQRDGRVAQVHSGQAWGLCARQ